MTKEQVRQHQLILNSLGANLVVDGIWGPKTQAADDTYNTKNANIIPDLPGGNSSGPTPASGPSESTITPARTTSTVTKTSTRDEIRAYQTELNEKGAGLQVDGIWGPLTEAAHVKYGETPEAEAEAEAAALPTLQPGADYTPDNPQGRFNVIGGNPDIWLNTDTGSYLVVYYVPNSEPPLPVYWEVPDEQTLQSYFGPDNGIVADKSVTNGQLVSYGALGQGFSTEIPASDQDPLLGWAEIYERQASVRPYLNDPEVIGLIMGAAIEGRPITQAELESTQWWQTHNEAQREWLIKVEADPQTALQTMESNRLRVMEDLKNSGVNEPPEDLVTFLTERFTTGEWSENILLSQIGAIADPGSIHAMRPEVAELLGVIDSPINQTQAEEDTVRDMLQRWLGPTYGAWTDQQIAERAALLRNDPDAAINFEQELARQRVAMFPEYEDQSLTYDDIAQPWRNFGFSQWGQQMDETDPLFMQVLRTNDAIENGKLLTQEGMRRGVKKVTTDLGSQIIRATGGSVQTGR